MVVWSRPSFFKKHLCGFLSCSLCWEGLLVLILGLRREKVMTHTIVVNVSILSIAIVVELA